MDKHIICRIHTSLREWVDMRLMNISVTMWKNHLLIIVLVNWFTNPLPIYYRWMCGYIRHWMDVSVTVWIHSSLYGCSHHLMDVFIVEFDVKERQAFEKRLEEVRQEVVQQLQEQIQVCETYCTIVDDEYMYIHTGKMRPLNARKHRTLANIILIYLH